MNKILVLLLFLPSLAFASELDSVYVVGWSVDAFTMEPVIDGTIAELLTEDSVFIEKFTPEWNDLSHSYSYFSVKAPSRKGTDILPCRRSLR